MFQEMFSVFGMMFLMILAGAYLRKRNVITDGGKKFITDLTLSWVLPCNIVKSFCIETNEKFWVAASEVLVVAVVIQFFCVFCNHFIYNRVREGEKEVYQYGTVCSNAAFLGNPVTEGVFGSIGLVYSSIFLIPVRIMLWTAGISYFTKEADKKKMVLKVLVNPCIVAVYIGIALMITGIKLPGFVMTTLTSFSNCCTPLTMIYIGSILVGVNVKELVSKSQIYFASIRLVIIPIAVLLGCYLVKMEPIVTGVCVLLTSMPAGATTSLLAAKYEADEAAAAKCVVFTTLLSVVTVPLWSFFLLWMLG